MSCLLSPHPNFNECCVLFHRLVQYLSLGNFHSPVAYALRLRNDCVAASEVTEKVWYWILYNRHGYLLGALGSLVVSLHKEDLYFLLKGIRSSIALL